MDWLPCRLDKYLRDASALSAPAARRALAEGRVEVSTGGQGASLNTDERLAPERIVYPGDGITLDKKLLCLRERHRFFILNKPSGVTSTTDDPGGQRDLSEFLKKMGPGVFPVGRLDRQTTGLLLFTSDGDLASKMLRPEHHVAKVYWLWIDEGLKSTDSRLRRMLEGVETSAGLARAEAVEVLASSEAWTELLVTLRMGLNRQLRRTCHALGLYLQHLHRRSFGPLALGNLPLGEMRELSEAEGEALWTAVGGRLAVRQRRIHSLAEETLRARSAGRPLLRLEAWLTEAGAAF